MRLYHYAVPANGTEVTLHSADGTEYKKVVHDAAALEKSRDIFCFSAFTSLRYSDATNLKWTDVSADSISFVTKKTADPIVVELNDFSRAILQKYADRKGSERFVFPGITNQRMNVYIKEVCELCEINTPVTISYYCGSERTDEVHPKYALIGTHCGRRTFVCSSLAMGIPAEIVMKWTGHADYKTMKPYIGVADSVKGKFMQRFNMQEDE
jgi:integrase